MEESEAVREARKERERKERVSELSFRSNPDVLTFPDDDRKHGHQIVAEIAGKLTTEYADQATELEGRAEGVENPMDTTTEMLGLGPVTDDHIVRVNRVKDTVYDPGSDVRPFRIAADHATTIWPWAEYLKAVGNTVQLYKQKGEIPDEDYCKDLKEASDQILSNEKDGADAMQRVNSIIVGTMSVILGFDRIKGFEEVETIFQRLSELSPQTALEEATVRIALLIAQGRTDLKRSERARKEAEGERDELKIERDALLKRYAELREQTRDLVNTTVEIRKSVSAFKRVRDYEQLVKADIMTLDALTGQYEWAVSTGEADPMHTDIPWPPGDPDPIPYQDPTLLDDELHRNPLRFDDGFGRLARSYIEPAKQVITQVARERFIIIHSAAEIARKNRETLSKAIVDHLTGTGRLSDELEGLSDAYNSYVSQFRGDIDLMDVDLGTWNVERGDTMQDIADKITGALGSLKNDIIKPATRFALNHCIEETSLAKTNLKEFYTRFLYKSGGEPVAAFAQLHKKVPNTPELFVTRNIYNPENLNTRLPGDDAVVLKLPFAKLYGHLEDAARTLIEETVRDTYVEKFRAFYTNLGTLFRIVDRTMTKTLNRFVEGMTDEGGTQPGGKLTFNLGELGFSTGFTLGMKDIARKIESPSIADATAHPNTGLTPEWFKEAEHTLDAVSEGYGLVYTTLVDTTDECLKAQGVKKMGDEQSQEKRENKAEQERQDLESQVSRWGGAFGRRDKSNPMLQLQEQLNILLGLSVKKIKQVDRGFGKFWIAIEGDKEMQVEDQTVGVLTRILDTYLGGLIDAFADVRISLEDTVDFYKSTFRIETDAFVHDLKNIRPDLFVIDDELVTEVDTIQTTWETLGTPGNLHENMSLLLHIAKTYKTAYKSCAAVITGKISRGMGKIDRNITLHVMRTVHRFSDVLKDGALPKALGLADSVYAIEDDESELNVIPQFATNTANMRNLVPKGRALGDVALESLDNVAEMLLSLARMTNEMAGESLRMFGHRTFREEEPIPSRRGGEMRFKRERVEEGLMETGGGSLGLSDPTDPEGETEGEMSEETESEVRRGKERTGFVFNPEIVDPDESAFGDLFSGTTSEGVSEDPQTTMFAKMPSTPSETDAFGFL